MVTDDKKREIEAIVDEVMHDPEKREALKKALFEKTAPADASTDESDDVDDLWDNLPI